MGKTEIMALLGGLALFLYGMQMMSSGLESAAGDKMKGILEKLTSNRLLGVVVGALITAIIQSSSATTVMVVGFVNARMMTLRQAVWIIMGANIGTTITGQLIALDVGAMAPLIAFLGVAAIVFLKNDKIKNVGAIFAGLGILFIGMDMMSGAMKPLAGSEAFISLLSKFENPILGILAGAVFTAIIQSSSASVGILQALANSGVVSLSSAAFVLFGQNIGTCITAFLASIGTSRNARRTTIIHVTFNVIGTVIFTVLCILTPVIVFMEGTAPGNPAAQIANLHTTFNVVTTLLLIPFGTLLAKLAEKLLPEAAEEEPGLKLQHIRSSSFEIEDKLGHSAVALNNAKLEIRRMMNMSLEMITASFDAVLNKDKALVERTEDKEEYLDFLNHGISKYISNMLVHEKTESGTKALQAYYQITSNLERIGDHAVNIAGYADFLGKKNIELSTHCMEEVVSMKAVSENVLHCLLDESVDAIEKRSRVVALEQKMDDMTENYRNEMLARIQSGTCSEEGSIIFSEMLTDFERIGDHAKNISGQLLVCEQI